MYYKFKLVKTGLKYLGTSDVAKNKKGILYVNEDELSQIAPDAITNIKALKDLYNGIT